MRRHRSSLLTLAVFLGCTGTPAVDAVAVRATIDRHNANLERWYLAGHADSVARVFAEDAWQMPPNAAPLVGRDSVRAFWMAATRWGSWRFTLDAQDVVVEGRHATERGRFTVTFSPGAQSPMPAFEDRGNYVVLWRLEPDGEWRILWDAPVSELPLAGASR